MMDEIAMAGEVDVLADVLAWRPKSLFVDAFSVTAIEDVQFVDAGLRRRRVLRRGRRTDAKAITTAAAARTEILICSVLSRSI